MGRAPIDAPLAQGPAYGLEVVVPFVDDPAVRWQAGVEWSPEQCGPGGLSAVRGECLTLVDAFDADLADNPETVGANPFVVWHAEACSTFSRQRDLAGRARRGLQNSRSFLVAQALWEGYDVDGPDAEQEQRPLAALEADTVTDGATGEVEALACLDATLARCGKGRRGQVHVPIEVLDHLVAAQALVRNGNRWDTPMGNVVIADAGYTGTGPNGEPASGSLWGYATSPVRVRVGAVQLNPASLDTDEGRAQAAVDLGSAFVNDVRVVAYQLAMYEWDQCCHFAAEFDVPACLVGGTS